MSDSDDDDDIAYMALVALLSDELEAPNRPRLSLACLPAFPKLESDWARIYRHGDSRSFVKLMMIDRPAFNKLLMPFGKLFASYSTDGKRLRRKRIRAAARMGSRKMTAEGCLGLTLMWLASTCQLKFLGILFGLLEDRAAKYLQLGKKLLRKVRWYPCHLVLHEPN